MQKNTLTQNSKYDISSFFKNNEDIDNILLNLEREKLKKSLSCFVQQAFEHVVSNEKYVHNWHIDLICERLQDCYNGDIKRLIINIPPGHMKSLILNVMLQSWIWLNEPTKTFINASYISSLSVRDSQLMRRLLLSDWYKKINPEFGFVDDQNAKSFYQNSAGGWRRSFGFTGVTGFRSDFICIDDPISAKSAFSKHKREAAIDFFDQELSNRLNNMDNGCIIIIMQRLHVDDLTGHCLRQNKILAKNRQWHHLCLPAIFDDKLHERSVGDNRLSGELLFPARFGAEVLEQEKKVKGGWGFAGQYQQSPFPAEGGLFKKEYFKNVKELDKPVSYFKNIIQCWDMTFKGGAKSDYVAGVVFAYDNGKFWLIDYIKKRLSFNESIDAVLKLTNNYLTTKHNIYIEDKANGSAIIDTMRNKLTGFSVKEINVNGNSKFARANSIEPVLASDNLFINANMGQDKINLFIDDMMQFREGGGNDDLVDATVHAITTLSKNCTSNSIHNIWAG